MVRRASGAKGRVRSASGATVQRMSAGDRRSSGTITRTCHRRSHHRTSHRRTSTRIIPCPSDPTLPRSRHGLVDLS